MKADAEVHRGRRTRATTKSRGRPGRFPLKPLIALLSGAFVLLLLPVAAAAVPVIDGEFDVSGTPGQLTAGSDGNVWVLIAGPTNEIARVLPDGTVTEFDVDELKTAEYVATGPDGALWFTKPNNVVRISPEAPTAATEFAIADLTDARGITAGPDGNLWAASGDKAIRIPPADPTAFTSFTVAGMGARGITAGGDGQLWIADFGSARVISVSTDGATITPYDVGAGTGPQDVAAGSGTQVAYTNQGAFPHEVGRISPGGTAQRLTVPGTDPFGIAYGADGAYWIAQFTSDSLGRLATDGGYTTLSGLSPNAGARWITSGPDNTLWVSLETALKVARVSGVDPVEAPPTGDGGGDSNAMPAKPRGLKVAKRIRRVPGAAPRRVKKGGQVRFRLAKAGRFRVSFERVLPGKRIGKRCVAPGRTGLKGRKACRRLVRVKPPITMRGVAGLNRVRFRGRINRKVVLKPGRYRLSLVALSATGRASAPARANFRLTARRR